MEKEIKKRKQVTVSESVNGSWFTLADLQSEFERVSEKFGIPIEELTFHIDDDDDRYAEIEIIGSREQTEEEEEKERQLVEKFRADRELAAYNQYLELKKRFDKPSITETI